MPKKTMRFIMEIEPHKPNDQERGCLECVLQHGPTCLDRRYCQLKETGLTWKKSLHQDTPLDADGRCVFCGAGDDAHHSYACPTELHPDRRR